MTPPNAAPADEPAVQTPAPDLVAATETVSMSAPVQVTESFTMKDDVDYTCTPKELDMVAKSLGLKDKKTRKKKS